MTLKGSRRTRARLTITNSSTLHVSSSLRGRQRFCRPLLFWLRLGTVAREEARQLYEAAAPIVLARPCSCWEMQALVTPIAAASMQARCVR
jgi:hypothetical protein